MLWKLIVFERFFIFLKIFSRDYKDVIENFENPQLPPIDQEVSPYLPPKNLEYLFSPILAYFLYQTSCTM
jgi:hypothetical protein